MNQTILITIRGVPVYKTGGLISWTSGLTIDADGSPRAYHPISSKGLDALANAGSPGNWWGVLTDNNKANGTPLVQTAQDPAPGYYVSTTALQDPRFALSNPRRYVDAETVPYLVIPPDLKPVISLGDFALVSNRSNGTLSPAIFADTWDRGLPGEGSIALANALKIPSNPRTGGCKGGVTVIAFPGSRRIQARVFDPHSIAFQVGLLHGNNRALINSILA